jgi:glycosyltransferase involved in cell wall biosynthesis
VRTALVHDWLTGMRGGEKVLDVLGTLYPDAPIFTLLHVPGSVSAAIESHPIRTSFVQHLPGAARHYRQYLPLFPAAVERLDLRGYDLVISTSHCVAKSVITPDAAAHLCYCHSPMRYAWDQFDAYFGPEQVGRLKSAALRPVLRRMARWDAATAGRVDRFVANSQYVAGRIGRYYNRGATVVYPPVDTDYYQPDPARRPEPFFLVVSALVPYKRLDVAIEAVRAMGGRLKIVGKGPEEARLRRLAGDSVEFLGWLPDDRVRDLYQRCQAVLMPGVEDFGLVPVEAQACGRPVVALAEGGALESVMDGQTGVLVREATVPAFADALRDVSARPFNPIAIRRHAERFSTPRFITEIQQIIDEVVQEAPRRRSARGAASGARSASPSVDPGCDKPAARSAASGAQSESQSVQPGSDKPAAREEDK